MAVLDVVKHPIVLAPLAGGPSTPDLTAAVANAGAFAFLAAGYLTPQELLERLEAVRALTDRPVGVNLFVPGRPSDAEAVAQYSAVLAAEAARMGVALGEPGSLDDHWNEKLDLLLADPVSVVSFTFGCPSKVVIDRLHQRGCEVWVTVTNRREGMAAEAAGADVVVAQGTEAGGHRGTWRDDDPEVGGVGVLALVQLLRGALAIPVVATGGIATGRGVSATIEAGASAAALGTAFMRCPEAGTSAVHRQALAGDEPTMLTRAFTGKLARGIRNRMADLYSDAAPAAYPEIHYLTAPLRQAGRQQGTADVVNLWAGQAYQLAEDVPAAEVVGRAAAGLRAR